MFLTQLSTLILGRRWSWSVACQHRFQWTWRSPDAWWHFTSEHSYCHCNIKLMKWTLHTVATVLLPLFLLLLIILFHRGHFIYYRAKKSIYLSPVIDIIQSQIKHRLPSADSFSLSSTLSFMITLLLYILQDDSSCVALAVDQSIFQCNSQLYQQERWCSNNSRVRDSRFVMDTHSYWLVYYFLH